MDIVSSGICHVSCVCQSVCLCVFAGKTCDQKLLQLYFLKALNSPLFFMIAVFILLRSINQNVGGLQ